MNKFHTKFGKKSRVLMGGPYMKKPDGFFGVKMAAEINRPCDVNIPTVDFSVPDVETLDTGLRKSLMTIARNKPIYVGCMGGIGRTGLFFAALAKVMGSSDPVSHVRANYIPHAVETKEQQTYIANYEPSLRTRAVAELAKIIALAY